MRTGDEMIEKIIEISGNYAVGAPSETIIKQVGEDIKKCLLIIYLEALSKKDSLK